MGLSPESLVQNVGISRIHIGHEGDAMKHSSNQWVAAYLGGDCHYLILIKLRRDRNQMHGIPITKSDTSSPPEAKVF